MGRDEQAVVHPILIVGPSLDEGMLRIGRLLRQHVEAGGLHLALPQCLRQGVEIDDRPARRVDENQPRLAGGQHPGVDHPLGFGRQRRMHADYIAGGEQLIQGMHPAHTDGEIDAVAEVGVVKHHIHAEGLGPQRRGGADAA